VTVTSEPGDDRDSRERERRSSGHRARPNAPRTGTGRLRKGGTNGPHPCIIDANVTLARFGAQLSSGTSVSRMHGTTTSERHRFAESGESMSTVLRAHPDGAGVCAICTGLAKPTGGVLLGAQAGSMPAWAPLCSDFLTNPVWSSCGSGLGPPAVDAASGRSGCCTDSASSQRALGRSLRRESCAPMRPPQGSPNGW
jgi:hypothetical protein